MTLNFLARRGFLPRAGESEDAFYMRTASCVRKVSFVSACMREKIQGALESCQHLFDVEPDWVPLIEERAKLAPWQGAVLWVDEQEQPLIQVAPRLWYSRDEMIAHELIHAVRLPLRSKRFEEIIAYQTSRSAWRRFFGPIIRSPNEVYLFLFSLVCSWIPLFWPAAALLRFATPLLLLYAVMRLGLAQRVFYRCRQNLSLLLGCKRTALSLAARLTDAEIALFAQWTPQEIRSYALEAQEKELRWKMLLFCYPMLASGS